MKKDLFIRFVKEGLYNNPEWLAETQLAIQQALESRISEEERKVADLGYAMSIYVENSPMVTERYWDAGISRGIKTLAKFFDGAQYGIKLLGIINKHRKV